LILWDITRVFEILSWAIYSPKVFFENYSVKVMIQKIVYNLIKVYGKSFNLVSFLAIIGFFILIKENRRVWWLMLVFILPFSLYLLNLGLFSGDHLIISFIPISFLASNGITYLLSIANISLPTKSLVIAITLFFQVIISYQLFIMPEIRDSKELKRVIGNLSNEYKKNGVMISDYNFGMAFWYLTKEEKDYYILTGRPNILLSEQYGDENKVENKLPNEFWINRYHWPLFDRHVNFKKLFNERPVYYVDRSDWPTRIVQFLLSEESLKKRKRDIPKLKKDVAKLKNRYEVEIVPLKIIDSPSHPVYLLNRNSERIPRGLPRD